MFQLQQGPAARAERLRLPFRALLELNVVSVLAVSSAVMRHAMILQKSGVIINVSSRAGKVGMVHVEFGSRPPSWPQNEVKVLIY